MSEKDLMNVEKSKMTNRKRLIIAASVFFAVCVLSFPLYVAVSHSVRNFVTSKIEEVQDKFDVKFTYSHISPAIFSGIRIYGISFYDYETQDSILTVKSIRLSYDLGKILRHDFENAFGEFVISGTTVEFEKIQKYGVIDKIRQVLGTEKDDEDSEDNFDNEDESKKTKKSFSVPFSFRIVDTKVTYGNDTFAAFAELKNIKLEAGESSEFFVADVKGSVSIEGKQSFLKKIGDMTLGVSLLGSVTRNLDEFEFRLRLNSTKATNFTLKSQQYICRYSQSVLNFTSGLNDVNAQLDFTYDFENQKLAFVGNTQNFSPSDVIVFRSDNPLQKVSEGIFLSSAVRLDYSASDKSLSYSAQGFASVDDNFDYGDMNILVDISGDEKNLLIPAISVDSKRLSFDLNLDCDLAKKQPVGTFFLNHYGLSNGNSLSFEMYFDKLSQGFMCFVPQLVFGQQFFTAMELDVIPEGKSVDYQFSVYDYMHQDSGAIGIISSDGSIIFEGKPYIQSSVSLERMYLESFIKSAEFFLSDSASGALTAVQSVFSSWIMSTELFVSTDFSSFSYNIPYVVVADTKKDGSMVLASLSGTEENSQISQFSVLFAGQEFSLNMNVDYSDGFSNLLFTSAFSLNSIPYSISGSFDNGKELLISGDYGFSFDLLFPSSRKKGLNATLLLEMLPLQFNEKVFSISFDGNSNFISKDDWKVDFNRIEILNSSVSDLVQPHLSLVGNVNNEGMMWKNIIFVDSASMLSGDGSVVWDVSGTSFNGMNIAFALDNDTTMEKVTLEGVVSNPSGKAFKQMNILEDVFCSVFFDMDMSPSSRFMQNQKSGNLINCELSMLGPVGNPSISIKMNDSSFVLGGKNVKVDLDANFEEGIISVVDSNLVYDQMHLNLLHGDFDLGAFFGRFESDFSARFITHDFESPVFLTISDGANAVANGGNLSYTTSANDATHSRTTNSSIKTNSSSKTNSSRTTNSSHTTNSSRGESEKPFDIKIPEKIQIKLDFPSLSCESFKVEKPIGITVRTEKGKIEFASDDKIVSGSVIDGSLLKVDVAQNKRFSFNLLGTIGSAGLNLDLNNFYLDFANASNFFKFPFFHGKGGIGKGQLKITGIGSDLDFYGRVDVDDLLFTVPNFLTEDAFVKKTAIVADDNIFSINKFAAKTSSGGYIDGDVSTEVEGAGFAWWKVHLKTRGDSTGKAKFAYRNMSFEGNVRTTLDILANMGEGVSVVGDIYGTGVTATFSLPSGSESDSENKSYFSKDIDLDIMIGPKCYVQFPSKENPMLKALVNPNTKAKFQMDSDAGYFNFDADLHLKAGSVVAFTRNFYLREGRLLFGGGKIDPFITLRGEMRETDADGNSVRIYLNATNQRLSNFNPMLTSSPAKSENEILALLGQFSADATGETKASDMAVYVLAGSVNYIGQSFVISKLENALRDFFKFDIFSLHPTILQNALIVNTDTDKEQNVGNYLNGSSVYVGKYIGNNMYLDALLNLEYKEGLVDSERNVYGLKIEPEFGFELESPFAFIRWSVAPDLMSLTNSWVPGASLSLSWKFNF